MELLAMNPQRFTTMTRGIVQGFCNGKQPDRAATILKQILAKVPEECPERQQLQKHLDEIQKAK